MLADTEEGAEATAFVWTAEAQRVRDVIEMHEFGVALYRQRMRREHPDATEAQVDALTRAWLADEPPHRKRPVQTS